MEILRAVDLDTEDKTRTRGGICDTYQAIGIGPALQDDLEDGE